MRWMIHAMRWMIHGGSGCSLENFLTKNYLYLSNWRQNFKDVTLIQSFFGFFSSRCCNFFAITRLIKA